MDPLKVTLVGFGALLFSTLPPAIIDYYSSPLLDNDQALHMVITAQDINHTL